MFVLFTRLMIRDQNFKYQHQTLKAEIFGVYFMRSKLFFFFSPLHSSFLLSLGSCVEEMRVAVLTSFHCLSVILLFTIQKTNGGTRNFVQGVS